MADLKTQLMKVFTSGNTYNVLTLLKALIDEMEGITFATPENIQELSDAIDATNEAMVILSDKVDSQGLLVTDNSIENIKLTLVEFNKLFTSKYFGVYSTSDKKYYSFKGIDGEEGSDRYIYLELEDYNRQILYSIQCTSENEIVLDDSSIYYPLTVQHLYSHPINYSGTVTHNGVNYTFSCSFDAILRNDDGVSTSAGLLEGESYKQFTCSGIYVEGENIYLIEHIYFTTSVTDITLVRLSDGYRTSRACTRIAQVDNHVTILF